MGHTVHTQKETNENYTRGGGKEERKKNYTWGGEGINRENIDTQKEK